MIIRTYRLLISSSIVFILAGFVNAQEVNSEITSAYTKINLDECLLLDADNIGASFACPGYKGFPLYVAEGDLRFFVSYGFGALDEMAARQTLPQWNFIGETLEWRLKKVDDNFMPFATILRFLLDDGDEQTKDGQILVVTKIEQGNTCHIAYIDTELVANANEVARDFADNEAVNFNCEIDDIMYVPS